jgi:tetratricopeptide (TPR) repeat protein
MPLSNSPLDSHLSPPTTGDAFPSPVIGSGITERVSRKTSRKQPARDPKRRSKRLREPCLDCGTLVEGGLFCAACSENRDGASEKYTRRFRHQLARARKLKEQHNYEQAIELLRSLAESSLPNEDVEKVQRRIQRVYLWKEQEREKAQARINRARKLIAEKAYEQAACQLRKIPDVFRDEQSERLDTLVKEKSDELTNLYAEIKEAYKAKRMFKVLPGIERFLVLAPTHRKARGLMKLRRSYFLEKAREELRKHEYARALALLTRIPPDERNEDVQELLDKARRSAGVLTGRHDSRPSVPPLLADHSPDPEDTAAAQPVILAEAPEHETLARLSWLGQLDDYNRWCLKCRGTPWVLAVYGHVLLLIFLYGVMLSATERFSESPTALNLTAVFSQPEQESSVVFETPAEADDEPEPELTPVEEQPAPAEEETETEDEETGIESEPAPPAVETREEAAETPAEQAPPDAVPEPLVQRAVTNGSFSVWSEPAVPIAGESYAIYVRVRLPDQVVNYPRTDLSGLLIGSDGYRKAIGTDQPGDIPLVGHTATIVIPVVGASQPEADTLIVRSRLLKQQKIIKLIYDAS